VAIKIVIDTNIWVSASLNPSGFPAKLRKSFEDGDVQPIISEPLLAELGEVLKRPRIKNKYGITEEDIEELLILIEERSEHVLLANNIFVCRDKDDNLVIETAIKGQAEYIVTRDDDLKFDKEVIAYLSPYKISIKSVAQFLSLIGKA
jgi:putative PIN family toxin of toxin-antitoxin system